MDEQPTIDERLQALTHNLELAMLDIEATRKQQKRLDQRERNAREALLSGIAAYLQALKNGGEDEEDGGDEETHDEL
ncbi:MAG TPA: hypothetical protein VNW90_19235 [Acetobacteraceae bacterium]|jgi:hypothetical protein|nr:hypothetical protein [Acetobacteraceae bacterium]